MDTTVIPVSNAPACFFSIPLCTYYFTYIGDDSKPVFVLFDDAASLQRKLDIGAGLGISEAFFVYAEVEDILPDLLARLNAGTT